MRRKLKKELQMTDEDRKGWEMREGWKGRERRVIVS